MKKLLMVALSLVVVLGLTACGKEKEDTAAELGDGKADIILITDEGTIDDRSFNQGSWEGVQEYAKENKDVKIGYLRPKSTNDDEYYNTIKKAIEQGGAKVIVTPGFLFNKAVYQAQAEFPDVHFIFVDSQPQLDPDDFSTVKVGENTVSLVYEEHQAGFLAGYAAVKEGMTKLGFVGGIRVPAVEKFGVGYLYGADAAAKELGVDVEVRYNYVNSFVPKPEVQQLAAGWYANGTEVIFSAAGGAGASVFAAAESANKKAIGVDSDQSKESDVVITSAIKQLQTSVKDALTKHFKNEFPGGQTLSYGIDVDSVGLPMDTSRFEKFKQADYDKIYKELKEDKDGIRTKMEKTHDNDFGNIKLEKVKVIYN
ncbi:BMP family ABC transporter substrate-binding protein [Erysipelothrix inopinata]|uniref:BMP family ABC transporter substrate-binding protein n=1 Tax=Erysipelothrix inopinata TaxID=225084 RepID=A0A7G9RXZ5_9FIRM|nr:BMP family ABC transporter substrate-binding protein [Erysipelothrix inopinata]QNN60470.1 BMP family ABC transporter substrate-binding protein [Erysipelothrix inopinata]